MIKQIAIITGTRAEYGILKPLLKKIECCEYFQLILIVTGLHLLEEYGFTINEIESDGFKINSLVEMYDQDDDTGYHGKALGRGIIGFTNIFLGLMPDLLVVLGDRLEPFAATLSAATLNIPIAHIHGGDKTDSGHIDENIRYSISKFSHLHFTATNQHSKRLIQMGEEPWRIHEVGALGLDSILGEPFLSKDELSKFLNITLPEKYAVCLFHPVSTQPEQSGKQMEEILCALRESLIKTMVIYPNNDMGNLDIIQAIENEKEQPLFHIFRNIPHKIFISLLYYSYFLIGNSSCGIIESPSLKLPVINVGIRNTGRENAGNVFFVQPNREAIINAISKIRQIGQIYSPYGDGRASERIVEIIKNVKFDEDFLKKNICY
ncbi:UDP-N,N'-diacetylbacillosamine 2-epimerase [anaerobic digester metagenome]